jgi:iron complex transport system substrate-binding protein
MRRITPARLPETLAFLMRRRALGRLGTIGALAMSQKIHAKSMSVRPPRIISVGGALTEIVYALEAQSCLVGVDSTSSFPQQAQLLPQVGYARRLSAEGVLALSPTSVLVTEEAGPPEVLRQISAVGVPVEVMDSGYRFEGLVQRIARIGRLLSCEAESVALIERLSLEWSEVCLSASHHSSVRPRVLFLFAHSTSRLMAAGMQTGAHAMIEYAGAINATSGFTGFKPLTPESLIAARPDVILLTEHGFRSLGELSSVLKLPGISQTPAGRHQRIAVMEASLLLGFGPRLPIAVQILSEQFRTSVIA